MDCILLIGENGQVTRYIQKEFVNDDRLVVIGRSQLDLTSIDSIQAILEEISPAIIINPAAYTAVDLAEQETQQAFLINRDAVEQIANYCQKTSTPLIHFSTDYVFDGEADIAYVETDMPSPSGIYGQSKFEGEQKIINSGAPSIILRTSWVYSNHGRNFYKTMLALSESRDELSVVNDQIGAPTYAGCIAKATKQLVDLIVEQGELLEHQQGVYHFTCSGQTSWHGFAEQIFKQRGDENMLIHGIPSSEYPTPAKRPPFSVLDCTKLKQVFGLQLPHWNDALAQCIAEQ